MLTFNKIGQNFCLIFLLEQPVFLLLSMSSPFCTSYLVFTGFALNLYKILFNFDPAIIVLGLRNQIFRTHRISDYAENVL